MLAIAPSAPLPGSSSQGDAELLDAPGSSAQQGELRKAFDDFVGQTFFSQLLGAMRQTVSKPAYFHGGRAEEIFQGQLDQVLAEKMAEQSADQLTGPMFTLFMLPRP